MKRIGFLLVAILLLAGIQANAAGVNVDSLKNELRDEVVRNSKEVREQQKDSIMLSKLSPNQLLEIKKGEQEVAKKQLENEGRNEMPFNGFELFMICALPFLFAGTIIILNVRAKNIESKRKYDLYTKSLEMGQTIPEHFFDEPKKASASSNLKRGVLWLAVGLAVVISFIIMHKQEGLILGIVPTFVGIGYLLVHYLDKPKSDSTAE
jgi:hypothetical protein